MSEVDLPKNYESQAVEQSIYKLWLDADAFHARPDHRPSGERYVIMMPLPNVTGALHMGHAMDNVMQDLLTRWHRMQGDNTLWMPGTDHAGIATQAVVEKRLKELEGLTRYDLGREGLVERIWQWKDQYQARIIEQQQRMGCGCDWQRQRFTMDEVCARAVRHTFFHMFNDQLIYRGKRLVNWDVYLQTSISDDEVYHENVQGHFWHLRYPVIDPQPGEPDVVVVATTRPETMLGDTAVAVHPDPEAALNGRKKALELEKSKASAKDLPGIEAEIDALHQRQKDLLPQLIKLRDMARAGRMIKLPLLDRPLHLICDAWAKPELGSGCVKITPAHDPNDYEVWKRHSDVIDRINVLNPDGTLNDNAGPYAGIDRHVARKKIVDDLNAIGLLGDVEERQVDIGHSDRSKTPIEPYLSEQWFIRMADIDGGVVMGRGTAKEHRSPGLVQAAMDAVSDGRVSIHPERYTKTYLDWLAEKRDWPVSRQLWWGHQIPVWTLKTTIGELEVDYLKGLVNDRLALRIHLSEEDHSVELAAASQHPSAATCMVDICLLVDDDALIADLEQRGFQRDPDVLDTWFSSALWPYSTLGWPDPESATIAEGMARVGAEGGAEDCLSYYYPGSCLVTGRDIITLWVARMVLAGLYNLGDIPFSDVFIHANILDGKGERMSKSKGNGIDPVDIINRYGTDAMRYVLCDMQTGTQDIRLPVQAVCPNCDFHNDLAVTAHGKSIFSYICGKGAKAKTDGCGAEFDVLGTMPDLPAATLISERFEVGRQFCTKLWNSFRFAFMNLKDVPTDVRKIEELAIEDRWILDQLNRAIEAVHAALARYNPSEAINAARDFFWGSVCDWYLELIKPRLYDENDASGPIARQVLAHCMDSVLRLLQPFVPFITEHLWQRFGEQVPKRVLLEGGAEATAPQLVTAQWPQVDSRLDDPELRKGFEDVQRITRALREIRASAGVSMRDPLLKGAVKTSASNQAYLQAYISVAERLAFVSLTLDPQAAALPGSAATVVGEFEIFVHDVIDQDAEKERLTIELAKVEKEIAGCEKKLGNAGFVDRAPAAVVDKQRERLAGYRANREALIRSIDKLS